MTGSFSTATSSRGLSAKYAVKFLMALGAGFQSSPYLSCATFKKPRGILRSSSLRITSAGVKRGLGSSIPEA